MAARRASRSAGVYRSGRRGSLGRGIGIAAMLFSAVLGLPTASADEPSATAARQESDANMTIQLTIDGQTFLATLEDSATARDFLALLPLTLTLHDYNRTEKVSDLPRRLSTEGAPAGIDPAVGDITYYAPWGNLALFYRDFGYASGLVRLGRIDAGIDALSRPGPLAVTIDRAGAPAKDTP